MTDDECAAAAVAMVTANRAGEIRAAADLGMDAAKTPHGAMGTMGFLVGMAAGLVDMLAEHGHDPDALLARMGLRIAQDTP